MKNKTLIALLIFIVVVGVIRFGTKLSLEGYSKLWLVILYAFIYILVSAFDNKNSQKKKENQKFENWPTSGPIGRYGQTGLKAAFYLSGLLAFLNPFQLIQILKQGIGNFILQLDKNHDIKDVDHYHHHTSFILPFEKGVEWLVYNGGTQEQNSHSWEVITQRFAYDFVMADQAYWRHEGTGTQVEHYYCYNQAIVAAAAGKVVKVVNHIRTAPFVGYGILDFLTTNFIGNHVIIEHNKNEYTLYAHLKKGSIEVKTGDFVLQGQHLGRCGHSGYSSEPHLHFHLQDRSNFYFARGLPIQFTGIKVNGNVQQKSYIAAGDFVMNV